MAMTTTKATLQTEYSTVTIEVPQTDMSLATLMENVIEPLLLAVGYSKETLEKYYRGE